MKKLIAAIAIASLSATGAWAGHKGHGNAQFAKVVDVEPLYKTVVRHEPVRECYVETVYRSDERRRSATGTILGGIIGAAIGNELGHHKRNKQVGAVAGGLLGASIGSDISRRNRGDEVYAEDVERCDVRHQRVEEQVSAGYKVTYRYAGELYTTRMDHHPGDRLPVRVKVTPAF